MDADRSGERLMMLLRLRMNTETTEEATEEATEDASQRGIQSKARIHLLHVASVIQINYLSTPCHNQHSITKCNHHTPHFHLNHHTTKNKKESQISHLSLLKHIQHLLETH
jgi:hypothetical protein